MLAPRTSNAFICLRCEARLSRPRLSTYPRRVNFSTTSSRRHGVEQLDTLSQGQPSKLKITREVQPLNRIRRRRGKAIRETSANLRGLKRLGEDADVLVLKEIEEKDTDERAATSEAAEPVQVPDILASLQQEGRKLAPEEIIQQIETLRPKHDGDPNEPHYVTQAAFKKLVRLLISGFTQVQLSTFYSNARNMKKEKLYTEIIKDLRGKTGSRKQPVKRTDWQPGTTSISKRLPGLDISSLKSVRIVSKRLLVDRILRDVWHLVLLEEIEAPGELELALLPWQVALLGAGDGETIFDQIKNERRAKLEVYKPHNVLRITADKTTAEYAATDVEEALKHTETKQFNIRSWLPLLGLDRTKKMSHDDVRALIAQEDLDIVSKITRTHISWHSNQYSIIGLEANAVAEAERLMRVLVPLPDSATRSSDILAVSAAPNTSYLSPVALGDTSLEQKYRGKQYGRYVLPVTRLSELASADDAKAQGETSIHANQNDVGMVDRVLKNLQLEQAVNKSVGEIGNWTLEPEQKLSAEIGQALYSFPDNASSRSGTFQASPAVFSPRFPGLASLLVSSSFSATARLQTPSLVYNFVPSPTQPRFRPGQILPSLSIQMRSGRNGGKATLHRLSLGVQEHTHDVLLPGKATDVRFSRYQRLRFSKAHDDENVEAWVAAVIENIDSGDRLCAPDLTLDIPRWTIGGEKPGVKGMYSIPYLFTGLQFRQSVSGRFVDTPVSYQTVQSGKLGARGGVLSAHFASNPDTSASNAELQNEDKVRGFVGRVLDMVDQITKGAANTRPVSRLVHPRKEQSARKNTRAARNEDGGKLVQGTTEDDGASTRGGDAQHTAAQGVDDAILSDVLGHDGREDGEPRMPDGKMERGGLLV
ncbi:hypothetical protein ACN47E_008774 [Coniothyrium glycines]